MLFLPYRQHCDPYSASIMGENVAEMCNFLAYGLLLLPIILHLSTFYMVLKRVKPTQIGLKMDNNIFAGGHLLLSILLPTILNMMVQLGSLTSFFLSITNYSCAKFDQNRKVAEMCNIFAGGLLLPILVRPTFSMMAQVASLAPFLLSITCKPKFDQRFQQNNRSAFFATLDNALPWIVSAYR